ncbi:MAG: AI-2E family transporter [Oscillospiraceae bacterium]
MKYRWDKKYLHWGITIFLVVVASITFFWILNRWNSVHSVITLILMALSPFIYGLLIAYLLDKILMFFEHKVFLKLGRKAFPKDEPKGKKFGRICSIIVTQLLTWIVIGGLLILVFPQLYSSIESLINNASSYVNEIVSWAGRFLENNAELQTIAYNLVGNLSEYITGLVKSDVLPKIESIVTNITGGVINMVKWIFTVLIGIVISIYIMYNKETFKAQGKKFLYAIFRPRLANNIMRETRFIHKAFGSFVTGKIIDSIIIGIITYIVLTLLAMPYCSLVSFIIGVTNIIPVFGPFIGAVPSALLILLESPAKCVVFVIFIIILQQFDGNILGPKILGSVSGLSGFWIMFAILFFGKLFGIPGMLFGVPAMSVIYNGLQRLNDRRLASKKLPTDTGEYKRIRYVDPITNQPIYHDVPPNGPPAGNVSDIDDSYDFSGSEDSGE